MDKELIDIFRTLEMENRLFRQEPNKDTCVAVTYLNLAVYLGAQPSYSPDEVKEMLDKESQSWEQEVFPKIAGKGRLLESNEFKAYKDWINKLIRLVNVDKIPVGISIQVDSGKFHALIVLKIEGSKDYVLTVYDPGRGFIQLNVNEERFLCHETNEFFDHHPEFHIYYPNPGTPPADPDKSGSKTRGQAIPIK